MLQSMTGFARTRVQTDLIGVIWELRSVNHRYLEISMRLPEALRHLETPAREAIRKRLHRGKIECLLRYDATPESKPLPLALNTTLAQQLIDTCESVSALITNPAPCNPIDIVRWQGVLQPDESKLADLTPALMAGLDTTLDDFQASRQQEGDNLAACIIDRLDQVAQAVVDTQQRLPIIKQNQRDRLLQRLSDIETKIDDTRLEQELLLLVQKSDIDEELDRLNSHIQQAKDALNKGGAIGRRLDFLMQEFNREANTLGSKAADDITSKTSVDLKVLIEQMREQIQNIE